MGQMTNETQQFAPKRARKNRVNLTIDREILEGMKKFAYYEPGETLSSAAEWAFTEFLQKVGPSIKNRPVPKRLPAGRPISI